MMYTVTFWSDSDEPEVVREIAVLGFDEEEALTMVKALHPELCHLQVSVALG